MVDFPKIFLGVCLCRISVTFTDIQTNITCFLTYSIRILRFERNAHRPLGEIYSFAVMALNIDSCRKIFCNPPPLRINFSKE